MELGEHWIGPRKTSRRGNDGHENGKEGWSLCCRDWTLC